MARTSDRAAPCYVAAFSDGDEPLSENDVEGLLSFLPEQDSGLVLGHLLDGQV